MAGPRLCVIGGCDGAGKTTLARELLPRMGLWRFLNADEIARGLSPLDPSLVDFKAGRLLLEETRSLIRAGGSFALESTLSGRTYVAFLREARALGCRIVIHYVTIGSGAQAVERVRLRVRLGGHDVPEEDVLRRRERSLRHFLADYLPLADEWGVWDNAEPPPRKIASSDTHTPAQVSAMLNPISVKESAFPSAPKEESEMTKMVLEAGRAATEKMLDHYKRMGIKVTPQMTLAPEKKRRSRSPRKGDKGEA